MPANRIVALFTPVIAVAAGATATWLADTIPGLEVSAAQLEAVFVGGLAVVLAPAAQWLYGAQKHERHEAELEAKALEADTQAAARAGELDQYDMGPDDYFDEYEEYGYDDDDPEAGEDDADFEAALAEDDDQPVPAGA
jgi:hypothetical protein